MLSIFDGRPGDGKSYSAVALKILPHLAAGGYVATNIEMIPDGVAAYILNRTGKVFDRSRLRILTEDEAPKFHKYIPPGNEDVRVLVVIDEAHLFFNARDWAKSDKDFRDTFNLATQHRKYFLDIILVSQHFGNIDAQFLRLIEELWRFRDLAKWRFPIPGLRWIRIPYFRFLSIVFDRNGKTIIARNWLTFDKLVGAAYNTRAVSRGSQMSGSVEKIELAADPAATARIRKARKFAAIIGAILAGVALAVAAFWIGSKRGEVGRKELEIAKAENQRLKDAQKKPVPAHSATPPAAMVPSGMMEPPKPKTWLDDPPAVQTEKITSVLGSAAFPRLRLEMDGVSQTIFAGSSCTRGRVMRLSTLCHGLYDVEISDETGVRHRLRCILANVPATGASNTSAPSPLYYNPNANPIPAGAGAGAGVGGSTLQSPQFGGYSLGL